jgi:hypothetical protein
MHMQFHLGLAACFDERPNDVRGSKGMKAGYSAYVHMGDTGPYRRKGEGESKQCAGMGKMTVGICTCGMALVVILN